MRGTTVNLNWFTRLMGWGVLGITAIVFLWIGLNASIAAVPSLFILYDSLSVIQFGFMVLESIFYLRSLQSNYGPLKIILTPITVWQRALIIALMPIQLLGYLLPAVFLGYGTYLAKTNYLNLISVTGQIQAPKLLDAQSEALLTKFYVSYDSRPLVQHEPWISSELFGAIFLGSAPSDHCRHGTNRQGA